MARKTAKDYRKELNELNKQLNALEARIIKRLETLCERHPDIPAGKIITANDILEVGIDKVSVDGALMYIEKIEGELAKKDKYVQGKMF